MSPTRWDPLTGTPMLLAPARTTRPHDTGHGATDGRECPFCPGAEALTPPEVWADRPGGSAPDGPGWRVRAVPNRFPVLPPTEGIHEVIVNTPRHVLTLWDLEPGELAAAIDGWALREAAVRADRRRLTPFLFVNQGAAAGASLQHSHAQVVGFPFVPPLLAARRRAFRDASECPVCREISDPATARIAVTDTLLAWCPQTPPLSGSVRIAPLVHTAAWSDAPGAALATLARQVLQALAAASGTDALNVWLHRSDAADGPFHWHLELVPRRGMLAGMELGAGVLSLFAEPGALAAEIRERLGASGPDPER
jgi:UDPglucose--hexose-1-phosphate uridylyltransferase